MYFAGVVDFCLPFTVICPMNTAHPTEPKLVTNTIGRSLVIFIITFQPRSLLLCFTFATSVSEFLPLPLLNYRHLNQAPGSRDIIQLMLSRSGGIFLSGRGCRLHTDKHKNPLRFASNSWLYVWWDFLSSTASAIFLNHSHCVFRSSGWTLRYLSVWCLLDRSYSFFLVVVYI